MVAPQRRFEKFRIRLAMQIERDIACNQNASKINEKPRQLPLGFSVTLSQARKNPATSLSTPVLLRWMTWIVAKQYPTGMHRVWTCVCPLFPKADVKMP